PRVCFEYRLQTGDLLLVNNLTTLQASHTSSMHNEYWSIHLQPDSINSPWQPHNRIVEQAELTSA
ncbi:pvcA protein, partial [Vibrio parahaemolyticus]|nr:pvcA protein [Vibrio parahaemolyticus]